MSFKNKNLSVIAYTNGFTLWHYAAESNESFIDITKDGYFDVVKTLMEVGDMFIISSKNKSGAAFLAEKDEHARLSRIA